MSITICTETHRGRLFLRKQRGRNVDQYHDLFSIGLIHQPNVWTTRRFKQQPTPRLHTVCVWILCKWQCDLPCGNFGLFTQVHWWFLYCKKHVATYMANLQNFIQDHKHVWCQDASVSSIQSHVSPCTSMYALSENISTFIDAFMNLDKAWCVLTQNMTMELLLLVLFVEWLHYVIAIYYRWMKAKPRVARNICTECNQKPGLLTMHVLQQLKSTYRMDWVHEDANHSSLNKCNTAVQDRLQNILPSWMM